MQVRLADFGIHDWPEFARWGLLPLATRNFQRGPFALVFS